MQPQYPTMPQFPQQPQPQYPAQPQYPGYPSAPQQYPPAPGYPQAPAYPQQYAQPAAPVAPLPTGTLDSFYGQPSSSGGPSFKFQDANRQPLIGKACEGFVARPIADSDVRAQTNDGGQVVTYKDGRPKFVLVVPMRVQPSPEFPEGQAGWWVKGQARDELARAMGEAGAPAGAPEAGAFIRVTLVGTRPIPGRNPAYQYRVEYARPAGAARVQAPQQAPATVQQATPVPVISTATGQPVVHQQLVPNPPQQAAPVQQVPVQQSSPAGFNEEQSALFAKLTGQQAA